jgi:hypothetical protein
MKVHARARGYQICRVTVKCIRSHATGAHQPIALVGTKSILHCRSPSFGRKIEFTNPTRSQLGVGDRRDVPPDLCEPSRVPAGQVRASRLD